MGEHVVLVGVELEGGWAGVKKKSPYPDITIHADASIEPFPGLTHYGEIASPPMEVEKTERWISEHYPQATNHKCGFHVHASVRNARVYAKLATRKFFDYWREETMKWAKKKWGGNPDHPIWPRLAGKNKYCLMQFSPTNQMRKKTKPPNDPERRTALNFAWGLHRTIECRVYPMFETPAEAFSAVNCFVGIINSFLDREVVDEDFFVELNMELGDLC